MKTCLAIFGVQNGSAIFFEKILMNSPHFIVLAKYEGAECTIIQRCAIHLLITVCICKVMRRGETHLEIKIVLRVRKQQSSEVSSIISTLKHGDKPFETTEEACFCRLKSS